MHNTIYCLVETKNEDWEDCNFSSCDFYEDAFILANTDYVSDFNDPEEAVTDVMDNLPDYAERTGYQTFSYDTDRLTELFHEKYFTFQAKARCLSANEFVRGGLDLFRLKNCISDTFGPIVYCEGCGTMWRDDFYRLILNGDVSPDLALVSCIDYHY